ADRTAAVPASALPAADPAAVAGVRRRMSELAGRPLVVRRDGSAEVARFLAAPELLDAVRRGPATPDHVIFTGPFPAVGTELDAYAEDYDAYFREHRGRAAAELVQRDPAPRVVLDPELGLLTAGRTGREAAVVGQIARHTMEVVADAEAIGGYRPADPVHV